MSEEEKHESEITYFEKKIKEIEEVEDVVTSSFDCGYGFMCVDVIWDEDAEWIEEKIEKEAD